LAWVDESDQLSDFMEFMTGNLSWEVARLVDWPEKYSRDGTRESS
jgi:hypothetical protein